MIIIFIIQKLSLALKTISNANRLLLLAYSAVFIALILQPAIFSPDTYSYLKAMPQRSPGYVVFIKAFRFLFSDHYPIIVVGFQLIFSLFAVHLFFKTVTRFIQLHIIAKIVLFVILIFPFFPPLYIANNLCSEGLSYSFYLFLLAFSIKFLLTNQVKNLVLFGLSFLLLVVTRGQFIILPFIVLFIVVLKHYRELSNPKYIGQVLLLIALPFLSSIMDKTYHKFKDGVFESTPFSYVNASGLAFYVSKGNEAQYLPNDDHKDIFNLCYQKLLTENLLLTSRPELSPKHSYLKFHNNVPKIVNQTIHNTGINYFQEKYADRYNTLDELSAFAIFETEVMSKAVFGTLIKHNFKDWLSMYIANLSHGFKSKIALLFIVFGFIVVTFLLIIKFSTTRMLLFFFLAIILSNAMIVAFASHSIMRYTFYNYGLIFLVGILLIQQTKYGKQR